jgi:N-dimethylarginine dimethylaminohydrolase
MKKLLLNSIVLQTPPHMGCRSDDDPANDTYPDGCFVQDAAVILDEVSVMASMCVTCETVR